MDLAKKHREIRNLIHHELKTPLVPILGYCEMLLNPKFGQLSADQKEAVEVIHGNVSQVEKVLNDILAKDNKKQLGEEFQILPREVRTPLIPILGYCEILLNPKFGPLSADQKDAINEIHQNSIKANNLINDFWNAQKLETGEMKYYFEDIGVDDFIKQEMENLGPLMKEKKIEFTKSIQSGLTIKADRAKLAEIFANLVENAAAFVTETGGKIQITGNPQDGFVQFSVVDNGPGIPKDGVENLFKKFYQLDTSHTRKHAGSGLGLTICRGYVEGMNGKIWAESEEGEGRRTPGRHGSRQGVRDPLPGWRRHPVRW